MKSIYLHQWQRFRRAPMLVVSFFLLTVVFVFTLAGFQSDDKFTVLAFVKEGSSDQAAEEWLDRLNESEGMFFDLREEEEVREMMRDGRTNFALAVGDSDYRMVVAAEDANLITVESYTAQVFREEFRLKQAEEAGGENIREDIQSSLEDPVLTVTTETIQGAEGTFVYDNQIQTLFGMTLFFSIYTMIFSLMNVTEEKRTGTWDRLIVSPLKKSQMYIGHFLYCFTVGYAQIVVIFLLFKYGLGFDLGGNFPAILIVVGCYAFAIVALGTLLMGLVKSSQQLQAVIPIVATAMAMLGGAFWPIEIVTNNIVLFLSQGMPILYALDALKSIAIYGRGLADLAQPLSILILFGVVCMGVGVNLMERRG